MVGTPPDAGASVFFAHPTREKAREKPFSRLLDVPKKRLTSRQAS
jgi:hypothetical protein